MCTMRNGNRAVLVVLALVVFGTWAIVGDWTNVRAADNSAPNAPLKLGAKQKDDGVMLRWDAPGNDASSYRILRRKPKECQKTFVIHDADTGNDETVYFDRDVVPGVRYIYRVQAINDAGISKRSNFAKITYRTANSYDRGAPGRPNSLQGTMTNDGILLKWKAPRGKRQPTGYQILRYLPGNCETTPRIYVENTGNTDTYFVDENVEKGTKYKYRVKALNDKGKGKWSNVTTVTAAKVEIIIIVGRSSRSIVAGSTSDMTIAINHMELDGDESTVDYILRGDATMITDGTATDMDECEGFNLGQDILIKKVDEVAEHFEASFGGGGCITPGDYTVTLVLTDGDGTELLTMNVDYEVKEA